MKMLKVVYSFLMQEKELQEEAALSQDFINEFMKFLKYLPEIKRKDLLTVPKLMEYICLVNP